MTMKLRAPVATLLIVVAGAAMAIQAPIASAAPTSTNVSCLPSTLQVGQTTTCVVNVTATGFFPFAPTGTVGMSSNGPGTFDGPCTLVRVGGGATSQTSQCAVDYTPARGGPQTIAAFFPGDAKNTPSGDNTFITVTPRPTTTTVSCSVSMIGVTGTCTATVTAANPSDPPPPSGTVFLSATSGTLMGTCFLSPIWTGNVGLHRWLHARTAVCERHGVLPRRCESLCEPRSYDGLRRTSDDDHDGCLHAVDVPGRRIDDVHRHGERRQSWDQDGAVRPGHIHRDSAQREHHPERMFPRRDR